MRRATMPALRFLVLVLLVGLWPSRADAVPVFARKYGFTCTMCHSAFPRLNDFGVRFRDNGYRLPGRENEERTVLQGPPPFAARVFAGYDYDHVDGAGGGQELNQFRLDGLDLLSAGLVARNIGYFAIYTPQIEASRGVAGQDGTFEMANVVFSRLGSSWLNVRAGRFEPAYVAFSAKRHLSLTPYEIYDFTFPGGSSFSSTQTGVEVFGQGTHGIHYAVGLLDGADSDSTGANLPGDRPADVYGRASIVFGAGEGQTAGQRIGVVSYTGKARVFTGDVEPLRSERERYSRVGIDASLNFAQWNVVLQQLWGNDDQGLWGARSNADFSGGFAEASWQPLTWVVAFARYDRVNAPDASPDLKSRDRYSAGARYYFADQLALHGEYSRSRTVFRPVEAPDATGNFLTVRLDFAF
jgi:hypothetical protein